MPSPAQTVCSFECLFLISVADDQQSQQVLSSLTSPPEDSVYCKRCSTLQQQTQTLGDTMGTLDQITVNPPISSFRR